MQQLDSVTLAQSSAAARQSVQPFAKPLQAIAVFGRSGREMDFGGLSAAQYIDHWVRAARQGDPKAAYEVYKAEAVCATADEIAPAFNAAKDRETYETERASVRALCAKVSPAQIQERLNFLQLAARKGNLDARIDYYVEGPYGRDLPAATGNDDPIVVAWKTDSYHFLQSAAQQCDPYALGLLANAFDAGDIVSRDLTMTLAYSVAESHLRKGSITSEHWNRRFGGELSPTQMEAGLKLGEKIASDSCRP